MTRLLAVLATALLLAGCGTQDPLQANRTQSDSVVVGSADFPESELLMDIYAEALRSTGTDVRTEGRIGAREIFVRAVRSGKTGEIFMQSLTKEGWEAIESGRPPQGATGGGARTANSSTPSGIEASVKR